jgi:hypothetical protein
MLSMSDNLVDKYIKYIAAPITVTDENIHSICCRLLHYEEDIEIYHGCYAKIYHASLKDAYVSIWGHQFIYHEPNNGGQIMVIICPGAKIQFLPHKIIFEEEIYKDRDIEWEDVSYDR